MSPDPDRIDVDALATLVAVDLRGRAEELGLSGDRLSVRYVLNWGGFVNQSFRIGDGHRLLHLKLSADRDNRAGLARWLASGAPRGARGRGESAPSRSRTARPGLSSRDRRHLRGRVPR